MALSIAGGVPVDRQDISIDNEHCGRDQGLDAHLLQLLPVPRASDRYESRWLCVLLLRRAMHPLSTPGIVMVAFMHAYVLHSRQQHFGVLDIKMSVGIEASI